MSIFRRRRRSKLSQTPWPETWRRIATDDAPLCDRLPSELRQRHEGLVQIFLAEKTFEGCGGLRLTDTHRVVIAAQACLLLLHDQAEVFPRLDTVLVYPDSFVAEHRDESDGLVTETRDEYLGESWDTGALVLSWADVRHDSRQVGEGYNVVLHEFAHQLDEENGDADGTPLLPNGHLARDWNRICSREYAQLCDAVDRGHDTWLDPYASEHPAEFFAVATEMFFAAGRQMQGAMPELYTLLGRYYEVDPAAWE